MMHPVAHGGGRVNTTGDREHHHELARAHAALGEYDVAAERYRQVIRTFQGTLADGGAADIALCHVLEEAGECWLAVGRPEAALDVLQGAVTRWQRTVAATNDPSHRDRLVHCLQLVAQAHTARGHERETNRALAELEGLTAPGVTR
jgi:tetratricopeptide (TPR) repeat protein